MGAAATGDMGLTLGTAIGGRLVGRAMARPATVRAAGPQAQRARHLLNGPEIQRAIAASVTNIVRHIEGQ
jgi:hypothetical protein